MPLRIIQPENHLMALSVLGLVCLAMSASSALAEEPATPTGVLTLGNGDSVPGHFVPSEEAEIVRWQGRDFVRPFEFRGSELSTVQFPTVDPPPRPKGNFALEMESGDFLTGDIENWTEEAVTFQSQHFGQLSLKSNAIRRLFRIEGNPTLTFPGLAGLNDNWKIIEGEWKTEGAQIHSSVSGSVLGARLEVPTKVCVELELSWKSQPNFVVAIGVDPLARKDRRQDGYRFETWGNTLAVVREAHEVADVEAVAKLVPETKSIHVQCFLDQEQGTMNIFSPEGKSIADIEVKPAKEFQLDKDNQGLRFIVRQGDLRIDRLRISQWDGRLPSALEPGKFSLHLTDGENATGEVLAFDPEKKSFQVQINDEERTVLLGDLLGMETLPSLNAGPNLSAMVLQDSTRVSGMVESINGTHVTLASPEIAAPIQVSLANLRAFASLQSKQEAGESQKSGLGKLRLDEHTLTGTLVNAEETDTDSCFSWQPVGSRTSSPLKWGTPGEVIYREAAKPESEEQRQAQERAAVVRRQQGQEFFQLLLKERQNPTVRRPATKETQTH
ncbi:MAG: hypothetical protein KDA80_15005, partial [Planctomycetaceae bacterium]|nr:hypothetical protein [Planctomycetaceae bacterium]